MNFNQHNLVLLENYGGNAHNNDMPKRNEYLIAYDSPDNSRRARLLRRIQGFGIDPQYSFHVCRLTKGERREMWHVLSQSADAGDDRLMMLRVSKDSEIWRLGKLRMRTATPGSSGLIWIG